MTAYKSGFLNNGNTSVASDSWSDGDDEALEGYFNDAEEISNRALANPLCQCCDSIFARLFTLDIYLCIVRIFWLAQSREKTI